jgi:hypothetical protein
MKRILILTISLCLSGVLLSLVASCRGKSEQAAKEQTQALPKKEPIQQIPDEGLTQFEKLANGFIRPGFDQSAEQTEKTVKPGDMFDLYVVAEYNPQIPMSTANYRLALPEGMSVVASANCDSTILTLGKYDDDFVIAFLCATGPKMWLVKYICKADPTFSGGTVEVQKGNDNHYLGFTMCDEQKTLVRSQGGKAVLKVE